MKKLRILVVVNELYPDLNATSDIALKLSAVLKHQYGCEITEMGYNRKKSSAFPRNPDVDKTIRISSITNLHHYGGQFRNRFVRLLHIMPDLRCLKYLLCVKLDPKNALAKEMALAIRRELKACKYDCIVVFSNPVEHLMALLRLKTDVPAISYRLDPWSTHYLLTGKKRQEAAVCEAAVDRLVKRIFVTQQIYDEYLKREDRDILRKLTVAEFPNIKKFESGALPTLQTRDDEVHCVFSGTLYRDIRNPAYAIALFQKLSSEKIIFHILGYQEFGQSIPDILPDNVIYHGQVLTDEAMRYMQAADILVNIGNTVPNQMPSKILTYISLGKPILNLMKLPDCPTLPYMERYPLALNVLETPEVQAEDAERVKRFILSAKGKQIPFEEIESRYRSCTPEYVGKQLYDAICEAVAENENEGDR